MTEWGQGEKGEQAGIHLPHQRLHDVTRMRLPNTPFCVDGFCEDGVAFQPMFFLSHAHTDHLHGLKREWRAGKIYCTAVTKAIVLHRIGLDPALVIVLPLDVPQLLWLDDAHTHSAVVTAIDANHCAGAAMFLFQGDFGVYLHTGDFRYHPRMSLHPALCGLEIDMLYLDNTFFTPFCPHFGEEEEAVAATVALCKAHSMRDVIIPMDFLGKESYCLRIGQALGCQVVLPQQYFDMLPCFGRPDLLSGVFTTDPTKSRIRIDLKSISHRVVPPNTIVIYPASFSTGRVDIPPHYNVSFSHHSSYNELLACLAAFLPGNVVCTSNPRPEANAKVQMALLDIKKAALGESPPPTIRDPYASDSHERASHRMPEALFVPELTRGEHHRDVRRMMLGKGALAPVSVLNSSMTAAPKFRVRKGRPRLSVPSPSPPPPSPPTGSPSSLPPSPPPSPASVSPPLTARAPPSAPPAPAPPPLAVTVRLAAVPPPPHPVSTRRLPPILAPRPPPSVSTPRVPPPATSYLVSDSEDDDDDDDMATQPGDPDDDDDEEEEEEEACAVQPPAPLPTNLPPTAPPAMPTTAPPPMPTTAPPPMPTTAPPLVDLTLPPTLPLPVPPPLPPTRLPFLPPTLPPPLPATPPPQPTTAPLPCTPCTAPPPMPPTLPPTAPPAPSAFTPAYRPATLLSTRAPVQTRVLPRTSPLSLLVTKPKVPRPSPPPAQPSSLGKRTEQQGAKRVVNKGKLTKLLDAWATS